MERKEVKEEYKWKTTDIFASDEEWEKAFSALSETPDFEKYRGTLNRAENVLSYFRAEEEYEIALLRVYLYAFLKHDEDIRVSKYNSYMAKVMTLMTKLGAETAKMPDKNSSVCTYFLYTKKRRDFLWQWILEPVKRRTI